MLALALVLLLGACKGSEQKKAETTQPATRGPQTPIVIPAGEPIVIGISAPLTGPDAVVGAEDSDAATVSVDRWKRANGGQIKGHAIKVQVEDDGCTEADITLQAAERLLQQRGLAGVIGPDCSAGAEAAIPVYAAAGIVSISGSATASGLAASQPEGHFFFRTAYRNDLEGTLAGLFTSSELKAKRVYLIDDGEPYGQDLTDAAQRAMEALGITVTRDSIRRGTVDFSELATKIAGESPDLVGFAGFNPEAALLYRQLRDAGYKGLFGAGDAAWGPPFIEPVGAQAAEGVLFAGCALPLPEDFIADFQDWHGHPPRDSAFVAQYADAATILLDAVAEVAVEQSDGSLSIGPVALSDTLRATTLQKGISGSVSFDNDGDRVPPGVDDLSLFVDSAIKAGDINVFLELGLVPCQVQDGKLVNLIGPGAGTPRLPSGAPGSP
jgi:ABC-type branched-subunit amino acid transport system substrate-binding protein